MALKGSLVLASRDDLPSIDKIARLLSQKLGDSVELDVTYDPTIIGGFIAEVGGRYYDASVTERLLRMKQFILG